MMQTFDLCNKKKVRNITSLQPHLLIICIVVVMSVLSCTEQSPALKLSPGNKWPGRVVINYNGNAAAGLTVDTLIVKKMIDSSIMCLTDAESTGDAWKAVFPESLSINSKIAIKIIILNPGNVAPHYSSVRAITDGLMQMTFDNMHFPASNITIYDANNLNSMASAGYTQERFSGIHIVKDTMIDWGDGVDGAAYAKSLHECNFLINVFSPNGHNQNYGNFFLGFKSHYGSYDARLSKKYQAGLRDMNCKGPVFQKTVLCVCCGIFGINEANGPFGGINDFSVYRSTIDPLSLNKNPNTIIMSTDPVTCEYQAIRMMRINKKRSYALSDLPDYLKASGGIKGTLSPIYNTGIIDEKSMNVHTIITAQR